jgi:hypothetical protein
MNNSSLYTADPMTHLKIVVVSLVFATIVAGVGVAARLADAGSNGRLEATAPVTKITQPMTASAGDTTTIR